mgnify:CR=1 FL=1
MRIELLHRLIAGTTTEEENRQLMEWFRQCASKEEFFMLFETAWKESPDEMPRDVQERMYRRLSREKKTKTILLRSRFSWKVWPQIAVACIIIVLGLVNYRMNDKQKQLSTQNFTVLAEKGQRAFITLPDSTKVWLNANSKLVYPTSFKEGIRQVELDGEAYFDVKHNGDNPFVVRTKSMNVTVLGTEFNVSAYSGIEEFNIALLRGSVELNSSDRSGKYRMKAGEQIFYREGKYVSAQIGNMDYFKWKEGVLSFNNQPIHVIIDKLRLYYDIRIEVADLPFLEERYSGKFRVKEGVEQVLKVLQLEHKFTYVKDNELNLITIK